ncbi:hypothetical protein jhhlp_003845 [Lomentospora prolificans]|uniref:Uncharacterized protein n=1 Tax=Lomentospora prolificans TaxID=41688 RepID=A0A2N3N9Y8_9PEZI|nr:hypothetical protein jhhlp_003845 [Lomentospora prolificans]
MRGLVGTALALLPIFSGLRFVNAQETATALIPLDLSDYGFDRELTLLFTLFESDKPCALSNIHINGQSLSTHSGRSGRETIFEDYGSEVIASWALQCIEVDNKPVREAITIQIDSVDGTHVEDVIFTVAFHQSNPIAILSVEGQATSAPILDISARQKDYWSSASENDDPDSEIQAAIEEIQLLRYQHREIIYRIKELETFVKQMESDGVSSCQGKFRCIMKHFLDRVAGIAAKAYSNVLGSDSDSNSTYHPHGQTSLHDDGNDDPGSEGISRPHIPLRRPSWRPLFCPCAPDDSTSRHPNPPSDDTSVPPLPITPPVEDDSPSTPDDSQTPDDDASNGSPDGPKETDPGKVPKKSLQPETSADALGAEGVVPIVVFMLLFASIFCAIFYRRRIVAFHQERRRRRLERYRRRKEAALAFVRRLVPGLSHQPCTDMEQQRQHYQQHYQEIDAAEPEPVGEMQQRTRRSQSDASNTMEQDLAQLRAAVAMVDNLVAGGDAMRETATLDREMDPLLTTMRGRPGSTRESPNYAEYSFPTLHHDLPPAYESEEEGSSAIPAISDGFRRSQGMTPYSPGYGTSSARMSADELGYRKP